MNHILLQSGRAKRHLENISVRRSTKLALRLKIDLLGNLDGRIGFSCFDWFSISSFKGILVSEPDTTLNYSTNSVLLY